MKIIILTNKPLETSYAIKIAVKTREKSKKKTSTFLKYPDTFYNDHETRIDNFKGAF